MIQYSKFVVGDVPFCVWEWDLKRRNIEFINGIDPDFYKYIVKAHEVNLQEDDKHFAALTLRLLYYQALESLFALLSATLQAPDCIIGWMQRYKFQQLIHLVENITHKHNPFRTKIKVDPITWDSMSNLVFSFMQKSVEKEKNIKEHFGKLWQRLAYELLDDTLRAEYNNIKHGLRVVPGGFKIAIGVQPTPHIPAPQEKMIGLGGSEFGSSFYIPENLCDPDDKYKNMHFRVRNIAINWDPQSVCGKLMLISISMHNVLSFIKIINGLEPNKVKFYWPEDESLFEKPWEITIGVKKINMDINLTKSNIKRFTKEEILEIYKFDKEKAHNT